MRPFLKMFIPQQYAHENTESVNREASHVPITAADPLHECTRLAVLNAVTRGALVLPYYAYMYCISIYRVAPHPPALSMGSPVST
jgi:hypothetical protein